MKEKKFTGTVNPEISERELRNRQVAREAAADGMVLLKNEGFLPLSKETPVALYGIGASKTIKGGTGSGDVNERERVSIYQGLLHAGYSITTEEWIHEFDSLYEKARNDWRDYILARTEGKSATTEFFAVYSTTPFVMPAGGKIKKTETDTAIYVISRVAGEGADRYAKEGDYYLTCEEKKQLTDICTLYEHVAVVINAGGLIDLSFMDELKNIQALVHMVQPGMEAGNAFADLVSGAVTPSAKLTDSWAFRYEDYPNSAAFSHNNGNVEKEYYTEGIYVGYRYFDTFDVPVRYCFGYGLSYTDFELSFVSVQADSKKKKIVISAKVTNIGDTYSGREVVQLYAACPKGRLTKEYRRLAAFAKTKLLKPGETQILTMEVPLSILASYDETVPGWFLESGAYIFWLGNSLQSAAPVAQVSLDASVLLTRTENICPMEEAFDELMPEQEKLNKKRDALMAREAEEILPAAELRASEIPCEEIVYRENAQLVPGEALEFVNGLSVDQLIALASGDPGKAQGGNLGAAGKSVPGSAGETSGCAKSQNLASIVLADGPAGLRLMKYYNVENDKILSKPFQFSLEGGIFCKDLSDEPGERYYQYCTAIPIGINLAQTWDTALVKKVGQMIGTEMEEFGVTLWLAPGMNIHRNPLCGRNFEYYAEDPLVAGKIAAAMTDGVQSVPGCGTTIKHFACNNQEDNRKGSDSILSERALREIYLKGFEIAVKESQPMSIMTSYNLINGVHAANCTDLCTKAARCEWGFAGMIMTDWTTTEGGPDCTASGCMRAGNDLVMPGAYSDAENLRKELEEGSLSIDDLKACIGRLVSIIWQSNQYEEAVVYKKC